MTTYEFRARFLKADGSIVHIKDVKGFVIAESETDAEILVARQYPEYVLNEFTVVHTN